MMPTETTVSCADCGSPVEATIGESIEAGCYTCVITVNASDVADDAAIIDDHVDADLDEDLHAVIYTECSGCCGVCSTPSEERIQRARDDDTFVYTKTHSMDEVWDDFW